MVFVRFATRRVEPGAEPESKREKTAVMIKKRFIGRQIEKSAAGKRTTPFLRRLVFQTVDAVSRSHYAKDYSMKCGQTAAATKMLLAKMGIDSRLTMGAVCFPKILWGGQFAGWTGFWDADYHVWLETEFNEIVDLSISQLHDHPRTIEREMQTPAIWWEQKKQLATNYSLSSRHSC